jgi:hypothetical protein
MLVQRWSKDGVGVAFVGEELFPNVFRLFFFGFEPFEQHF